VTFEEALAEAKREGLSRCSDAAAMAAFCKDTIQIILGAVSGKLIWEGAQRKHMTYLELAHLCQRDPHAATELMW
jgi:hypothetical protein